MLDRQVRDAAPGVEGVLVDECAGRAGIEAGAAAAAARFRRLLGRGRRELEIDEQLAEHHVAAEARRDQHRVLRDESDPAALGPLALEDRRRIDARSGRDRSAELRREPLAEQRELVADHEVIVLAAGVAGDPAAQQAIGRHRIVAIVDQRDQVVHLAGVTRREPAREQLVAARWFDRDDRDPREPELARELDQSSGLQGPSRSSSGNESAK
jgi:hypothetical protein